MFKDDRELEEREEFDKEGMLVLQILIVLNVLINVVGG